MDIKREEISAEIEEFIEEHNLEDGDYVIIVIELTPINREIKYVYKTLNDFNQKYDDHVREMDPNSGVRVEWYTFD